MNDIITNKNDWNVKLEDVLSSKGRIRILMLVARYGELNISAISKKLSLNHSAVRTHLQYLTKFGLLKEKNFGRIKIFQFQESNIKAQSLKQLFTIWEE